MKKIILLSIVIISLFSCKKSETPTKTNVISDTANINVSATITVQTGGTYQYGAFITITTDTTISTLFANAYVSFDVYDSTSFKYTDSSKTCSLKSNFGTGNTTYILTGALVKPNIQNVVIDSVMYDQASVPTHFLKFHY